MSFNWNSGDWLNVSGIVDWTCSAPDRQQTSVGSERFTFGLHREPAGGFTIAKEDAQIMARMVSKARGCVSAYAGPAITVVTVLASVKAGASHACSKGH